MDILYYSNYCKHSQKILQILGKSNQVDKISFICIDKRTRDPKTNQQYIVLENGGKVVMPPNLHSVPAMLLIKQQYRVIYGDEIMDYLKPRLNMSMHEMSPHTAAGMMETGGEPMSYQLGVGSGGSNIVSEAFTFYDMSPEELSSKGKGMKRQMYNYVSANNDGMTIPTPPDNYRPDKISSNVTIDKLQQQRMSEIDTTTMQNTLYNTIL